MKSALRALVAVMVLLLPATMAAGTFVQFRTLFGDIEVELLDSEKPLTVANFLRYVQTGAYEGSFFHRLLPLIGFPENGLEVLQAGSYVVTNRSSPAATVSAAPTFAPVASEYQVGPFESNVAGTLAMALRAYATNSALTDPNSGTSGFFFNLVDNSAALDNEGNGAFTVFGKVRAGTNVLNIFNGFTYDSPPATNIIVNAGGPFASLPVTKLTSDGQGGYTVALADLFYVDITTLRVRVTETGGVRQISWNSATQATNIVEFTSTLPPQWKPLATLVRPVAGTNSVTDASGDPRRFYRVRAAY